MGLSIVKFESNILSSNMYIIHKKNNCILIDPSISKSALKFITEKDITVEFIILTHEHYDHISGVNWWKEKYNCKVVCNRKCAQAIKEPKKNLSSYFDILLSILPTEKRIDHRFSAKPYSCEADMVFDEKMTLEWLEHQIILVSTPGHSKGSICILLDNNVIFTGDSLLRDYPSITKIPGGSRFDFCSITEKFIKSLPFDIKVKPGHFESFILREKKW